MVILEYEDSPLVMPGPGAGAGNKSNQGAVQLLQPDLWPHYTTPEAEDNGCDLKIIEEIEM